MTPEQVVHGIELQREVCDSEKRLPRVWMFGHNLAPIIIAVYGKSGQKPEEIVSFYGVPVIWSPVEDKIDLYSVKTN